MQQIEKQNKQTKAIRIIAKDKDKEIGRAWLYLISNDLHKEPYGLLEDVFVEENYRSHGIGSKLVNAIIEEAKERGCYKLIGCSRNSRPKVHKLYEDLGFAKHGVEFRMNLK